VLPAFTINKGEGGEEKEEGHEKLGYTPYRALNYNSTIYKNS